MFDPRYLAISLAGVFIALAIGVLFGAALADPELVNRTELQRLRDQVDDLEQALETEELRGERFRAAEAFVGVAYDAVMQDRLADRRVLVLSVGATDERVDAVSTAVTDAGGSLARLRAFELPSDAEVIQQALEGRPALAGFARGEVSDVGRALARELVDGGRTPILDALAPVLVVRQRGELQGSVDAAVVVRTASPQTGAIGEFVTGLYEGLDGAAASVGAEFISTRPSAIGVFRRAGLSTVDNVETEAGKVALAVLLAGDAEGHFGLKESAEHGILPPIAPVVRAPDTGG